MYGIWKLPSLIVALTLVWALSWEALWSLPILGGPESDLRGDLDVDGLVGLFRLSLSA